MKVLKMKNKGEVRIGFLGILFIVIIVLVALGKINVWHILLFPFYLLGGCFGIALTTVLCILLLIGIVWLIFKFIG